MIPEGQWGGRKGILKKCLVCDQAAASSHPKGTFHIPSATMPEFFPVPVVRRPSTRDKHALSKRGGRGEIPPECSSRSAGLTSCDSAAWDWYRLWSWTPCWADTTCQSPRRTGQTDCGRGGRLLEAEKKYGWEWTCKQTEKRLNVGGENEEKQKPWDKLGFTVTVHCFLAGG